MRLVLSKEAVADLDRLRMFLSEKEAPAAERAVAAIHKAIRSLEVFPGRGRPSGIPGARELVVPFGRTAYLIRYAYVPRHDAVIVIRVWHRREMRN